MSTALTRSLAVALVVVLAALGWYVLRTAGCAAPATTPEQQMAQASTGLSHPGGTAAAALNTSAYGAGLAVPPLGRCR